MKNSIKRAQSQACLNFAERKNFGLQAKYKILSLLALLLTAVSGAWAQDVTWNVSDISTAVDGNMGENESYTSDGITMKYVKIEGNYGCTIGQNIEIWGGSGVLEFTAPEGMKFAKIVINGSGNQAFGYWNFVKYGIGYQDGVYSLTWEDEPAEVVTTSSTADGWDLGVYNASTIEFYFASDPIEVTPVEGQANKWSFAMPGSDVVLTPQYAPVAAWAEVESVKQLPAAAEGVIAGTDASLIAEGTGIVANAGETENPQGLVMYAVSASATEAPALGFSATVPTAQPYDEAQTLYVWYYIAGANTPDGEVATDQNTFNDSEICATPLKVTLLSNKFNLTLKPAPVDKIDVLVDEAAPQIDQEGKIENVQMGKEVKLKANTGYKFRKVEVKKAAKLLSITVGDVTIYYAEGDSWANAISRDENKDSGLFIREGNRVHHPNYGQLVDSNTQPVLPDAKINANESYRFIM